MKREIQRRPFGSRDGRIISVALLFVMLAAGIAGSFYVMTAHSKERKACDANLKKIYHALELYEVDRGSMPSLAYFPTDPQADADSLSVVLESYGADARACVCPAMHAVLREMGLTYIWNSSLNGKRIPRGGDPVWLLVEMSAISEDLPAPHLGHFNVLFSDGSVRHISDPRKELPGL